MNCDTDPRHIRIADGRAVYSCAHGTNDWRAEDAPKLAAHIKRVHALRPRRVDGLPKTTIAGRRVFGIA